MNNIFVFIYCYCLLLLSWQCSAQINEGKQEDTDRQAVYAGQFYPGSKGELTNTLGDFFRQVDKKQSDSGVAALISPHAGYPYSGKVAASAYNQQIGRAHV